MRPHLGWFIAGTACAAGTSLAAASYGLILKEVVEGLEALGRTDGAVHVPSGLGFLIGLITLAASLRALFLYAMTLLNNTGVQRAIVDIQDSEFTALIEGDYARLSGEASGGYVSRFINDVTALRDATLRIANNLTKGILTLVAVLATMLWMDWLLTLALILVYPLAIAPVVGLGNRIRTRSRRAQEQAGKVTALLSEAFQSARAVKAYGLEGYERARAGAGFRERARLFLRVLSDRAAVDPILEVTGGLAIAGVLALTAWRIATGDTSLGNFVGIVAAIGVAAPEVRALGTLSAVAQEGGAAADRVFEITDARPGVTDAPHARPLVLSEGHVRFETVSFHYPCGSQALCGLSFEARRGETVALVGASGAGKSTVINLLLRLYDRTGGLITIDGQDIATVTQQSLRASMAIVSQETALFDDSLAANIALGRLDADDAAIRAAARAAHADGFITALPQDYDTPAGEFGRNLSGGQRQRIALARAILRDAPILLLDEATSALDAESEAAVQAALAEVSTGRTVIVIAHRLATVRSADRIVVMEAGRAVETGTHDALVAAGGAYARLAALQFS